MSNFLFFLLTLLVAAVGGFIGYKLKLPAGAMVGAMVATVVFNLLAEKAYFYADLRVILQILGGAMIGSRISKKDIMELKTIILPTVILLVSMVILNLTFGVAMYVFSDLDIATSLFASAPGGVTDMAIISADLGANPAYVAILQLLRILTIFICLPPIFKKIIPAQRKKQAAKEAKLASAKTADTAVFAVASFDAEPDPTLGASAISAMAEAQMADAVAAAKQPGAPAKKEPITKEYLKRLGLLFLFAGIGGVICWQLGITAGAMIGAMVASAVYCVLKGTVKFPVPLRLVMQVASGAFIGIRLDRASVMQMGNLLVPMLIMIIGIFVFVFAVAFIMHKLTGLELSTCLMSCTPGGVQEMSLLSEDLGADTPKIAIMQTTRLFTVILLFPTMLSFVTGLFR